LKKTKGLDAAVRPHKEKGRGGYKHPLNYAHLTTTKGRSREESPKGQGECGLPV